MVCAMDIDSPDDLSSLPPPNPRHDPLYYVSLGWDTHMADALAHSRRQMDDPEQMRVREAKFRAALHDAAERKKRMMKRIFGDEQD